MEPVVIRRGALDMQVCVPGDWSDDKVERFAERENPSGTNGWHIRREGDPGLSGDPERVQCMSRKGFVHIMLDA